MQLWLIPLLPLLGFALNGIFGKKLSKPVVNAIACGSVLLSFVWVLKTLSALGVFSGGNALEEAYKESYFTWIQSGMLNISVDFAVDRLTAVMLLIVTGIGKSGHLARQLAATLQSILTLLYYASYLTGGSSDDR